MKRGSITNAGYEPHRGAPLQAERPGRAGSKQASGTGRCRAARIALLVVLATFLSGEFEPHPGWWEGVTLIPWRADGPAEHAGVYEFGFSKDASSELLLIFDGSEWHAQIRTGHWVQSAPSEPPRAVWVTNFELVSEVRVERGSFSSSKTGGEFVSATVDGSKIFGLKVAEPWSRGFWIEDIEVGVRSERRLEEMFPGDFPQTSSRPLEASELRELDKRALQLMRSEILARHGGRFDAGSEMDRHFESREWYVPRYDDVSDRLTGLEQSNIRLISQVESGDREKIPRP